MNAITAWENRYSNICQIIQKVYKALICALVNTDNYFLFIFSVDIACLYKTLAKYMFKCGYVYLYFFPCHQSDGDLFKKESLTKKVYSIVYCS